MCHNQKRHDLIFLYSKEMLRVLMLQFMSKHKEVVLCYFTCYPIKM